MSVNGSAAAGQDVLLLPGMMCDARLWAAQAQALGNEHRVHLGSLCEDLSVEAMAARQLAAMPPRFSLAGLSMGAIVAFAMWRLAPQRVTRLALLDTNFRADTPERMRLREEQVHQVRQGHLRHVLRDELKPHYLAECHRDNTALLDEVVDMGMQLGADVFVRQSIALRDRPDSSAILTTIDCPTLVLCGDEDRLCPVELHREMAGRSAGADLRIIPRCGHLATMEQPDAVTAALLEWLQKPDNN